MKKSTNTSCNAKRSILGVLSAPVRYLKSKVNSFYKKLLKKEPKETDNEERQKRKSVGELKKIAKLRRIKNMGKLKKEGLITSILKSEISNAERDYMKHFNTNVDKKRW